MIRKMIKESYIAKETPEYIRGVLMNFGRVAVDIHQNQLDRFHRLLGQDSYDDLMTEKRHDYLTRALSRAGVYNALKTHSEETKESNYIGVFIDVCNLRKINNQYSQYLGDKYLHIASWASRGLFDLPTSGSDKENIPDAMVGRWGGDEFLAIFPANTPLDSIFMDFFSFSEEGSIDDKPKNTATFHIDDMLSYKDDHNLPASVYKSANELIGAGINDIKFAYNIGVIDLGMSDGTLNECKQVIEEFMRDNGSKYVRKNTADR